MVKRQSHGKSKMVMHVTLMGIVVLIVGVIVMKMNKANRVQGVSVSVSVSVSEDGKGKGELGEYKPVVIYNFMSSDECDKVIEIAKKHNFEDSGLYKGDKDDVDQSVRKSKQTWLHDNEDPLILKISKRVAKTVKLPVNHQEAMQVLYYTPGGKYEPHYDACFGDETKCSRMNSSGGPRYKTLIVYLNDGYVGGGTVFPKIHLTTVPKKGMAVIFDNVDPVTHKIIPESMHGGEVVESGEKWLLNKWIHTSPYDQGNVVDQDQGGFMRFLSRWW